MLQLLLDCQSQLNSQKENKFLLAARLGKPVISLQQLPTSEIPELFTKGSCCLTNWSVSVGIIPMMLSDRIKNLSLPVTKTKTF